MSYYKLKNIDIKNRSIKVASNNVRPLDYFTTTLKTQTEKDFIKSILFNIVLGNFQPLRNENTRRFRVVSEFFLKEHSNYFEKVLNDFSDSKVDELKSVLYALYLNIPKHYIQNH